ncbi:O-antigen ligase [uncultured Maricaulis sp.]|uniref:O-antigen ligase family protein n=1 Tax=uncultured Maricaulis sp. TaxID=174710 RepID=UPI0030D9B09D|tara:strand:+ start:82306 stop:83568 length:1263 start_codon:yes stop_codon:yes gene_type:complete
MSPIAAREPLFLSVLRQAPGLRSVRFAEAGFTVVGLFLFSQALIGPLFAPSGSDETSVILRLMWLPVYGLTILLMLARPGAVLRTLSNNLLLVGLIALMAVSVMWSVAPDVTIRRTFALAMSACFGLWIASRWSWREMILLIATTFALLGLTSTFMALAVPAMGVDHVVHPGAWKGVFWEKNTLGGVMAWGVVSGLAAIRVDPKHWLFWAGCTAMCVALVLLSTSKTALLSCLLGTGLAIGIALCRRGFGFASLMIFLGLTGGITIATIMLVAPVEALEALGRDATLTGRTDIWGVLIEEIRTVPWTGYGYMAFWSAENGPVFWVRQATHWDVPTAHNGWIEIALAIGIPGVVMTALVYFQALLRAVGRIFNGPETYWALGFISMILLVSISESNLVHQNSLGWVMFVATSAKLAERRER